MKRFNLMCISSLIDAQICSNWALQSTTTITEGTPEKYARFIPLYDRHLCWSLYCLLTVESADQRETEKLLTIEFIEEEVP